MIETEQSKETKPTEIPVTEYNVVNLPTAVQLTFYMLEIAYKRGAFSMEESSKITEAIRMIKKPENVAKLNGEVSKQVYSKVPMVLSEEVKNEVTNDEEVPDDLKSVDSILELNSTE